LNLTTLKYSLDKRKPGKTKAFFICLFIASFLWLVHSLNTVYSYTFKIPVTFKNVPQNKKPLVELPEVLSVEVKASGLRLALILLNKPFKPLEIDFNTLKSANRNQNYVLSASNINLNSVFKFETRIKHILPDTLYFSEKTGFQKTVPVKIPLYIKCKEGYGYKKPAINPAFITIWGDTTVIENIDTMYTQPLTLSNLNHNVNSVLPILRPDPNVYTNMTQVNITVEVAQLIEQTVQLPVQDIHTSIAQEVNIYPSTVKVRFTSIQNAFNLADTSQFKARIDSKKINPKSKKCKVFLSSVPGDITVMEIDPREVEILIFKK
jgi:YbbR domain-containing protein